MPQRTRIFKVNSCLKVHNTDLKKTTIANFGIRVLLTLNLVVKCGNVLF